MRVVRLVWLNVLLMFVMCLLFTVSAAVYPVPGSYYSVLLRYNSRAKTRKGARIGPSPHRLWAYFDPPSVLGSLALGAIDNNLETHNKKRSAWANQERARKTVSNDNDAFSINATRPVPNDDKIMTTTSPPTTENSVRHEQFTDLSKQNTKTKNFLSTNSEILGTCGGNEKVILDPYSYVPDSEGRFFHKVIQTIGFPTSYPPSTKCIWNIQIGRECQMGMVVVEIIEGTLLESSTCNLDSINILFNGESKKKTCGRMTGTATSLKWTKTGKQLAQISFESKSEENTFRPGQQWGAKISLSGYCWVYAPHFITQSLSGIKDKAGTNINPSTENIMHTMVEDSIHITNANITTTTEKLLTTTEEIEATTKLPDEITTEQEIQTTDNFISTEFDLGTESEFSTEKEMTTIEELTTIVNQQQTIVFPEESDTETTNPRP